MNNYEKTFMENIKNIIMLFLMYVGHAISFLLYKMQKFYQKSTW
jgi:hypothetical protein